MKNNKEKKISLRLVLCLLIIVLLISVIAGMWYYFNYIHTPKDNNHNKNDIPNNTVNQLQENKDIIMYLGMNISNTKPGIYTSTHEYKKYEDFYNTTYDMYENGNYQGKAKGKVIEGTDFEGNEYYYIEYEQKDFEDAKKCIFVSCNYNVVPRNYELENNIPNIIKNEFSDYDSIKMQSIDLDGDGKKEYLVSYSIKQEELSDFYLSGICLYDSNYKKISDLASLNAPELYLADFDSVTYMDIDNDNNMEIIINIPVGSSYFRFGIYKYANKTVEGTIETFGFGG